MRTHKKLHIPKSQEALGIQTGPQDETSLQLNVSWLMNKAF